MALPLACLRVKFCLSCYLGLLPGQHMWHLLAGMAGLLAHTDDEGAKNRVRKVSEKMLGQSARGGRLRLILRDF